MNYSNLNLYLEINQSNFIFFITDSNNENNIKVIDQIEIPLAGIENNRVSDIEKSTNAIKQNIYLIEQKLNYTFKEIILIIENFNPKFINLSGFKKLNGSQVLRENITYILNTLKSCIDEFEIKKTVVHIFNSKFFLDNKEIENLPIGLFGDFYSHELSFVLINSNDYKNIKSIFDNCNLNIKKILIKSFIKGANKSENLKNADTFFQINIYENNSKIFYFENNSLKFEQNFKFGTNIIIRDISKITSLKIDTVKMILNEITLNKEMSEDEFVDESHLINDNNKKIKKKLIYEIATARIEEISEIILSKNINFFNNKNASKNIFLEIDQKSNFKCLEEIYKNTFSAKGVSKVNFTKILSNESMLNTANKLVNYGWKKEAIPIYQLKKSFIAKFFDKIFG